MQKAESFETDFGSRMLSHRHRHHLPFMSSSSSSFAFFVIIVIAFILPRPVPFVFRSMECTRIGFLCLQRFSPVGSRLSFGNRKSAGT